LPLATALYEAILRSPGIQNPAFVMLQSKMNRALGKTDTAIAKVSDLAKSSGPGAAEALVNLIEEQAPLGHPIPFAQVQALEAYLTERRDSPEAPRFERALILAKAASGDFDGALTGLHTSPAGGAIVWQLLAKNGPNSAFLSHASLKADDPVPEAAKGSAVQIAERMLGLGLSDQAALWLAQADHAPATLTARVKLALGDAQAALSLLKSQESAEAMQLRAQAYQTLGNPKQAAELYAKLGQRQDQWHAMRQARDWPGLGAQGPAPWKALAELAINPASLPEAAKGQLAQDMALIDLSAATHDAIVALLDQTKASIPVSQ